jgi:RNA polymerase sigma factor (sigma-70 family)
MTPRRLIEPARLAGTALLHTQSDERLVDLTRAGNDRAFEAIVTRYRRPLLRYCSGLLPPERAEDAVQQAFMNAYRAITAGEAELQLRPWLYRIAHNASLNLLRQNGWSYDQIPEDFDGVVQPPQAVEQKEHIRSVVRAVKDLPERQRDAIVLRELEGRSYEEIAVTLGVSGGAVRQLLNRARTTLRAAATAVTPPHLLERLAERAASDGPAATRVAELTMGAGGAATLAKVGTALVVAGAVAGGVVTGPLHHSGGRDGRGAGDAQAAELTVGAGDAGAGGSAAGVLERGSAGGRHGVGAAIAGEARRRARRARHHSGHSDGGAGGGGTAALVNLLGGGEHRGPGGRSGSGEHHSGSGSGDRREDGSSGGSGHDGSGGDDHSGSGSSDSGSGDGSSGSGSSGSGSGDSGTSGSGDSGSSSSGSGTSGSGDSGTSGSGSGDSGTSGSGDGTSGSGDGDHLSGSGDGSGDPLPPPTDPSEDPI